MGVYKDKDIDRQNNDFPKHACQHCGSISKLVETIIDDQFEWDGNQYIPN